MLVFNQSNTYFGDFDKLKTYMLIGKNQAGIEKLSLQISEVATGGEQPLHRHSPEQCYYIIEGEGLMRIEAENRMVYAGDAIYIPSNAQHGIKNSSDRVLKYLTANTPAFDSDYENRIWTDKK